MIWLENISVMYYQPKLTELIQSRCFYNFVHYELDRHQWKLSYWYYFNDAQMPKCFDNYCW